MKTFLEDLVLVVLIFLAVGAGLYFFISTSYDKDQAKGVSNVTVLALPAEKPVKNGIQDAMTATELNKVKTLTLREQ